MKLNVSVFAIFLTAFLQQVICIKKSSSTSKNQKLLDEYVQDVKEIRNITNVVLEPLLSVQAYFTFNNTRASDCFETENESYRALTINLAKSLNREKIKLSNQKQEEQEKNVYDLLQTLITTFSTLGERLEAMIQKGPLNAVAQYITVMKEKIKKQCDSFLLIYYKLKLEDSEITKKIEKGIQDAYYKAETKSKEIVDNLIKCIKSSSHSQTS